MCLQLAAPTSTFAGFASFSLSQYCCLHFGRNKFGSMLAKRHFKGQRSSTNYKILLFVSWRNQNKTIQWPLFDALTCNHGVFTCFSLSKSCCLHFCRNKFRLLLVQGYFTIMTNIQSSSASFDTPSSTHQIPKTLLISKYLLQNP